MRVQLDVKNLPHPLLEHFELRGVNKYKHLILGMPNAIKIVAAENGTGKTTLLMHYMLYYQKNLQSCQLSIFQNS